MQREISLAGKIKEITTFSCSCAEVLLKYLGKCRWKGALELIQSNPLSKAGLSEGPEGKCIQPTDHRTSSHSLCWTFSKPSCQDHPVTCVQANGWSGKFTALEDELYTTQERKSLD